MPGHSEPHGADDDLTVPPLPDLGDQLRVLSESDASVGESFGDSDGDR